MRAPTNVSRAVSILIHGVVAGAPTWHRTAQRLATAVVPEHYALSFAPDLKLEQFSGEAHIRVRALEPTSRVVLHAAGLQILDATIRAGNRTDPATVTLDAAAETVTLETATPIPAGAAELHLTYRGPLTRELRGFYISEAHDRKYAVPQLQATDARRMFPAFDEPHYKATFDIRATVDEGDTAISNGAVESVTPGPAPGTRTFDFATTKPMSTYLVALAVGDFECEQRLVAGTPVGVCATPGNQGLTTFPLAAAEASLRYFKRVFHHRLPIRQARSRRDSRLRRRRDGKHRRGLLP